MRRNPRLRKQQAALGFGYGPAKLARGLDPFGDHDLRVGECFLPCRTIGRTARKLGNFGDERVILGTPIQNDLVLRHRRSSVSLY